MHAGAEPKRRRLWPWVGGAAVAVNVVVLALLFGVARDGAPPADTPQPTAPGVIASAAGEPAGGAATSASNAVPGSVPATGAGPLAGTPAPSDPAHPVAPAAPRAAQGRALAPAASETSPGATNPRPLDPRATPARATTAARDDASGARGESSRSGAYDASSPARRVHDRRSESAADAGTSAARVAGARGDDLKLQVLVYADDPSGRSAWINGQRYVEGQRVHGRLVVEKITPDAVVLGGEGPRVVLRQ
jgi:hypothetical protein